MFDGVVTKYYAGIGARKTPPKVLQQMTAIAHTMKGMRYILRSGGAAGADSAFENGAYDKQIFTAADATNRSMLMASRFHPNWGACNKYVCQLHGRNMMILFGPQLNNPVDFVVCYTPGGQVTGGTGQALRAAEYFGIPIINLATQEMPMIATILNFNKDMTQSKTMCHTTLNRSNHR